MFYDWFRTDYLVLLIGLILFNFYWGLRLTRAHKENRSRPWELGIGIVINLSVLGFFKYTNFALENIAAITGHGFDAIQIILPIGISFFIFQKIAYLVDTYRGVSEEYDLLHFSLFIMFFPQLIAGPIVHHKEMIPQFREPRIGRFSAADLSSGLTLFTLGLIKKIVIADTMGEWADPLYTAAFAGNALTFIDAWGAALFFTFQIYFDFSGYTDMALGLALMIGIRLPLNFNSPYKASSIVDFWRRWHMTLSRFLRDYVYFSLGGNRLGPTRRYANLMLTMLLGGLWHGASWTFVIWGGLHGFYLVINHGWNTIRDGVGLPTIRRVITSWSGRVLTFLAVVIAWVFFRAENLPTALSILEGMAGWNGIELAESVTATDAALATSKVVTELWQMFIAALLVVSVWMLPNSLDPRGHASSSTEGRSCTNPWVLIALWRVAGDSWSRRQFRAVSNDWLCSEWGAVTGDVESNARGGAAQTVHLLPVLNTVALVNFIATAQSDWLARMQ